MYFQIFPVYASFRVAHGYHFPDKIECLRLKDFSLKSDPLWQATIWINPEQVLDPAIPLHAKLMLLHVGQNQCCTRRTQNLCSKLSFALSGSCRAQRYLWNALKAMLAMQQEYQWWACFECFELAGNSERSLETESQPYLFSLPPWKPTKWYKMHKA